MNDHTLKLAQAVMAVWGSGDVDQLDDLFHPDAIYDDIPNGVTFEGLDQIKGYIAHVHSWASSVEVIVSRLQAGDSSAVAEWVMTGVQSEPIAGRLPVATHRPFRLTGATIFEIDGSRIRRAADYIDVLSFVIQLGAEVHLPGGVTIGGS